MYANLKIYLHGQEITGWTAVLTCEPKYITNIWNNPTEGGVGKSCWTLEIIGNCKNKSKKKLHKRTALSLITLFHTGVCDNNWLLYMCTVIKDLVKR